MSRTEKFGREALRIPAPHWVRQLWTLAVPLAAVYLMSLLSVNISSTAATEMRFALGNVVMVVALQAFVGNSGVLSFGHVAFSAVGAWTVGLLTLDPVVKKNLIPTLFPFLQEAQTSAIAALVLAAVFGAAVALVSGLALMRLNGLQAGIATFALLMLVSQVLTYWRQVAPSGGQAISGIPEGLDLQGTMIVALIVIVAAWLYQRTLSARQLRAARESALAAPASGINITAHRVIAFTFSGLLAGVGGGLWAQSNHVIQASQFDLAFTFTMISMLVIGGMLSLWGAVAGTLVISAFSFLLTLGERGWVFGSFTVTLPSGTRGMVLAALLIVMLMFRPTGITGGREPLWPFRSVDAMAGKAASAVVGYPSKEAPTRHSAPNGLETSKGA